ncbi:TPA: hypothetical protein ACPPAW_000416 [Haemophilus influenzae]|uniref:hypothetical protein n=1 Tax=Haemophilus influenzae TaxID=727 RepID=UPI001EFCA49B|nr:hypothetical protein [Haemophilus influenzae]
MDKFLVNVILHSSFLPQTNSHFGTNEVLTAENEKLNSLLTMKDTLLAQKDDEIKALKEIIELLKSK